MMDLKIIKIPKERAVLFTCFGIALTFWLLVKLSKNYQADLVVQVEYQIPDSLAFIETPPATMRVVASGEGWDLLGNYFGLNQRPLVLSAGQDRYLDIDPNLCNVHI